MLAEILKFTKMNNQKFGFDKIVMVFALLAVIAFAILHSAEVSNQMKTLNYPSAMQFNYK